MSRSRRMLYALVLVCLLPLPLVSCRSTGARISEGAFEWLQSAEGQVVMESVATKAVDKATDVIADKVEGAVAAKTQPVVDALAAQGVQAEKIVTIGDAIKAYQDVRQHEKETGRPYEPVTGSLMTDILVALVSAILAQKGGGVVARRWIKDKAVEMIKSGLAPKPPA